MDSLTNLVVAYALLTSPPQDPGYVPNLLTGVCVANVAVQLQVLDPKEVPYTFNQAGNTDTDLRMLQERWQKLRYAPRLEAAECLPDRAYVREQMSLNSIYQQQLRVRSGMLSEDLQAEIRPVIEDLERRWLLYDKISDATCPYYYISTRREALLSIVEMVGPADFYSRNFPPALPLNFFEEID